MTSFECGPFVCWRLSGFNAVFTVASRNFFTLFIDLNVNQDWHHAKGSICLSILLINDWTKRMSNFTSSIPCCYARLTFSLGSERQQKNVTINKWAGIKIGIGRSNLICVRGVLTFHQTHPVIKAVRQFTLDDTWTYRSTRRRTVFGIRRITFYLWTFSFSR